MEAPLFGKIRDFPQRFRSLWEAGCAGDGVAAKPLRWLFAAEAAPTFLIRREAALPVRRRSMRRRMASITVTFL
jgi:hypothetical protein